MAALTVRRPLLLHPDSRCPAVTDLAVTVARPARGVLRLDYALEGAIADLALPSRTTTARADELWKHSCFEAFLRGAVPPVYVELNFAPSGAWAAYRLDSYRSGLREAGPLDPPQTEADRDATHYRFAATVGLDALPELDPDAPWTLGVSAVIEERNGNRSYWALAHGPGSPDFHHEDCFALRLPPA